jgi:hypothetical protein
LLVAFELSFNPRNIGKLISQSVSPDPEVDDDMTQHTDALVGAEMV